MVHIVALLRVEKRGWVQCVRCMVCTKLRARTAGCLESNTVALSIDYLDVSHPTTNVV